MVSSQLGAAAFYIRAPYITLTIRNIPNQIHGQRCVHARVQVSLESTSFSMFVGL